MPTASPARPELAQVRPRNRFRVVSHAAVGGREHHTITAPRRGENRERARQAILKLLARAAGHGCRVSFTVTTVDGSRWRLGSKGGYDPARAETRVRAVADTVRTVLDHAQVTGTTPLAAATEIARRRVAEATSSAAA